MAFWISGFDFSHVDNTLCYWQRVQWQRIIFGTYKLISVILKNEAPDSSRMP